MKRWIAFFVICFVIGLAIGHYCHARDLGQNWKGINPPEISQWYRSLLRPNPGYQSSSCCGDADGYWCDDITVKGQHVYCAITDIRDDKPLMRPHRPLGEIHEIPAEKMKWSSTDPQKPRLGNPTGHAIIFLGSNPGSGAYVYCFVPNELG